MPDISVRQFEFPKKEIMPYSFAVQQAGENDLRREIADVLTKSPPAPEKVACTVELASHLRVNAKEQNRLADLFKKAGINDPKILQAVVGYFALAAFRAIHADEGAAASPDPRDNTRGILPEAGYSPSPVTPEWAKDFSGRLEHPPVEGWDDEVKQVMEEEKELAGAVRVHPEELKKIAEVYERAGADRKLLPDLSAHELVTGLEYKIHEAMDDNKLIFSEQTD